MEKEKLYGKTLNELVGITRNLGMPGFSAMQIADWLYKKKISAIEEMTNLSKKMRENLSEKYEIGLSMHMSFRLSNDGTKKYLFKVGENKFIETAYIPENDRSTVCISTQIGCRMGCIFCMTGKQGFQGNLTSNEILNQFRSLPEFEDLTNMVFMGMGEPLDNISELLKSLEIMTASWGYAWSPTRITVSTIGLVGSMRQFLENTRCHLAVSLHTPFDTQRRELMPVQKTNPISEILDTIRGFDLNSQRRISFEYILFRNYNDSARHIKEIARILNGIKCRINLIRFHPIPGSPFESPEMESVMDFRDALTKKGITTTIRASRGVDIMAACGLLSTLEQNRASI
jgi:23S rRNA (adenine2503-C2)-methyltransferase